MEEPLKIWWEATCLQTMFLLSVPHKNHLARRSYPWSSGKHRGKVSRAHRHMNNCTLHPAPQIWIWHLVGLAEHQDRKNISIIKSYEKVLRAVQLLGKTIPLTTEQGRQAAGASNTGGLLSWHFRIQGGELPSSLSSCKERFWVYLLKEESLNHHLTWCKDSCCTMQGSSGADGDWSKHFCSRGTLGLLSFKSGLPPSFAGED